MNCVSLKKQKGATKMKRGFTLIEIMIVIAVMAILIGIALPYFRGMQEEGWTMKAAGELRTLVTAIESYYIHNGGIYPSPGTSVSTSSQADLTSASPKIITSTLKDPFQAGGGTEYSYCTSGTGPPDANSAYYVVFSVGADGGADISAIDDTGSITGSDQDDIYFTNAEAGMGGF